MMRFAADENFNNDILRGLFRHNPDLDVVRIQDTQMYKASDPDVLEWVAHENRILLTHDARTIPKHTYERIEAEQPVPGVFIVDDQMPIGQAIEELLLLIVASKAGEWENLVVFLPL